MKILFLSSIFPHPSSPVTGTFNFETCRALARNHDVRVVAPRHWLDAIRDRFTGLHELRGGSLSLQELDVSYPPYFCTPKVLHHHYGSFMWASIRDSVHRACQDFTPDAVLSYWVHPDGEAGIKAAHELNVPSAVIVGGSDVLILPKVPKRREKIVSVLRNSDAIFTVSEGLRQKVIELGANEHKAHTLYQGIRTDIFQQGDRQAACARVGINSTIPTLLWVGRMVPVKGLDLLLEAAAELRDNGVNFQLQLVGEGPLRPELLRTVQKLHLGSHVTFVGAVQHHELADWYRAADVTVLSSLSEGLPNVLRESLACGTPFVSTNVGSISEIANPAYSRLTPAGDAKAFAAACAEVIQTDDFQEGARAFQPESWTDYANSIAGVLTQLRGTSEANQVLQQPNQETFTAQIEQRQS